MPIHGLTLREGCHQEQGLKFSENHIFQKSYFSKIEFFKNHIFSKIGLRRKQTCIFPVDRTEIETTPNNETKISPFCKGEGGLYVITSSLGGTTLSTWSTICKDVSQHKGVRIHYSEHCSIYVIPSRIGNGQRVLLHIP